MTPQQVIARSIVFALLDYDHEKSVSFWKRIWKLIAAFFALHQLRLGRKSGGTFRKLRSECWKISEDEYWSAFEAPDGSAPEDVLSATGDMGYSGSTFFTTTNQQYLVKSVPRHFEYSFFEHDLLDPYAEYMSTNSDSLLVRIYDFLAVERSSLGSVLNLAPTHHIVMENIFYGREKIATDDEGSMEFWDLKPTSYFFPERDIAQGRLTSEATKSKLADKFDDKIILTKDHADALMAQLAEDTRLLAECNAVDYSLFLIRIKLSEDTRNPFRDPPIDDSLGPLVPPSPPSWRTGIPSSDGVHIFRMAVLDFFWAKHKMQPRIMTGLVKIWNVFNNQGPMSITTTSDEYRSRFLGMVEDLVEVRD